jgi:Flp pilus assembly protein TadG
MVQLHARNPKPVPKPDIPTRARKGPLGRLAGRWLRESRSERGTALVEFVLVLPVLLIILFGVLDFGKAFNYWLDEGHLAGQGARWAAVNTNPGSGVTLQAYIKSQAETSEMTSGGGTSMPSAIQVCITFPTNSSTGTSMQVGDPVTVTVNGTYNWMTYIAGKTGIASSTISSSETMRLEQVPTTYSSGCA